MQGGCRAHGLAGYDAAITSGDNPITPVSRFALAHATNLPES